MSSITDKYLSTLHNEAKEDFDKGEDKDGRDDNDKIGEIHDMISELYRDHKLAKEAKGKETADKVKESAEKEEEKVEE